MAVILSPHEECADDCDECQCQVDVVFRLFAHGFFFFSGVVGSVWLPFFVDDSSITKGMVERKSSDRESPNGCTPPPNVLS